MFGVGPANEPEPFTDITYGAVKPPGTDRPQWEPGMCNVPEIEFLRRSQLGLTSNIVYSRRCVKPARRKAGRSSVIDVPGQLITSKTKVNLTNCANFELPPCEAVSLPVPSAAYPRKQYPHLLFGVASSYERLHSSLPEFTHWLSSTGAQLLGIVADANEGGGTRYNLSALEAEYRDRGILATFVPPSITKRINRADQQGDIDAPVEQHHFLLVRELSAMARPGVTRWISIIDDDTFFPSLYPLDQELARYDHTQTTWLGALSDDFNSVRLWGYMAYGGAGVFLSAPLASVVADRADQCLREATTDQGDGLLRDCIYTHTRTTLTIMRGLYQHDFRGDPSGFFESGLTPLSLHHWKSWYKAPVAAISRIATHVCGSCLMQRYRFGNNTLLSNGYSVVEYAKDVLPGLDLSRVEGTWSHASSDYDPTYGQLRPKVKAEDKKSYLLRDAIMETRARRKKVFRQLYVYRAGENAWEQEWAPTGVDEVIELVWEL